MMLGQILKAINSETETERYINSIEQEQLILKQQIQHFENQVSQLDVSKMLDTLKSNESSYSFNTISSRIKLIEVSNLQNEKEKQTSIILQFLKEQINQIINISKNYSKFLGQTCEAKQISEAKKQVEKYLQSYEHQRNQFIFNNDECSYQKWTYLIHLLQNLNSQFEKKLDHKIREIVIKKQKQIIINSKEYQLFSKQKMLLNHFTKKIDSFFSKMMNYSLHDKKYSFEIYQFEKTPFCFKLLHRQTIIFRNNQTKNHYKALLSSIKSIKLFFQSLRNPLLDNYQHDILTKLFESIQYLIPYLSLQERTTLSKQLFENSSKNESIYTLLILLKLNSQNGNVFVQILQEIVKKIKEEKNCWQIVLQFINLSQEIKGMHNMIFFMVSEMVVMFEQEEDISYTMTKNLLSIREEIRYKIHFPQ